MDDEVSVPCLIKISPTKMLPYSSVEYFMNLRV